MATRIMLALIVSVACTAWTLAREPTKPADLGDKQMQGMGQQGMGAMT